MGPGGLCMQAGLADLFRGSLGSDPSLEKEGNWWCRGTCRVCLATTACQGICRVRLHTYFRDRKDPDNSMKQVASMESFFLAFLSMPFESRGLVAEVSVRQ